MRVSGKLRRLSQSSAGQRASGKGNGCEDERDGCLPAASQVVLYCPSRSPCFAAVLVIVMQTGLIERRPLTCCGERRGEERARGRLGVGAQSQAEDVRVTVWAAAPLRAVPLATAAATLLDYSVSSAFLNGVELPF